MLKWELRYARSHFLTLFICINGEAGYKSFWRNKWEK